MSAAYVLVHCDMGYEESVISEIKSIKSVKEVRGVFGAYDIVVKVEAPSSEILEDVITTKIRRIDRIRSTLTLPIIAGQG
ncbi:Lrp/AsnC family transcriptional regulator [Candidatus Nitrosotenuis cloacae]|jgi:DNA-binding Lrp family transcriptional regulator|uniref:Lrp/AsnC family transcriptional regulator n=1 Tax=Candidatus Nitrosotenuis cloacae TaxID=1603555 RepID=UPI0022829ADF|nr:Lrp/AsnC ligand binding domain-containing protein [Candidatus Nitrosotenuis cloacae]